MKRGLSLLPYLIMSIALVVLWREVRAIDTAGLLAALGSFPAYKIVAALGLTALHFIVMSLYDCLGLHQLGERLPYPTVLRTSFIGFSLSNLVGHSVLTGLAVRIRAYLAKGVTLGQITQIAFMNVEAWWIGFLFLCGVVLIHMPSPHLSRFSSLLSVGMGISLLGAVATYLVLCWRCSGRVWQWRKIRIVLPSLENGLSKMFLGIADTLLLAATLFVLLPEGHLLAFADFLSLHLTAHFLGVISMVPGGLGVLESALLKMMPPQIDQASVLISLLLFRLIHYVIPALIGLIVQTVIMRAPVSNRNKQHC